jgi:hypothetical protein
VTVVGHSTSSGVGEGAQEMPNRHAVVLLDHREATVVDLSHHTTSTIHFIGSVGRRRLHVRSGVPVAALGTTW